MNILLFTGHEELNNHLINVYKDLSFFVVNDKSQVIDMINQNSINKIIITIQAVRADEETKFLLINIQKKTPCKIVFFYGEVNNEFERDQFRYFLITKSIYNFHDGDITPEALKFFLFNDRDLEYWSTIIPELRDLIFNNYSVSEPSVIEKIVEVPVTIEVPIEVTKTTVVTIRQEIIGLFGNVGKTSHGLMIATELANKGIKVCFLDLNLISPALAYYLNSTAPSFSKNISDKGFSYYSPFESIENLSAINGIYGDEAYKFNIPFSISNREVSDIIVELKNHFDVIVLDTSGQMYSEINQLVFRLCTKKLYFTNQSFKELEEIKRIQNSGYFKDVESCHYVINYFNPKAKITTNEFVNNLAAKHCHTLEYIPTLNDAIESRNLSLLSEEYLDDIEMIVNSIVDLPRQTKRKFSIKAFTKRIPFLNK